MITVPATHTPLKAYLDTANWYDLADGRIHAPAFEEAVKSGRVIPVLSFIHPMEFAVSKEKTHQNVINYIECIRRTKNCCWIKTLPMVAALELRQQLLESHGITPQPLSVFTDTFVDTLNQTVRGLDRAAARTYDLPTIVSMLINTSAFRRYRKLRSTDALSDLFDSQVRRAQSGLSIHPFSSEYLRTVLTDMPSSVTTDAGLIIDVTPQCREELLHSLQWEKIPAISLRLAMTNGWSRAHVKREASDFGDLFHIAPPLAYCDVTFADKRTTDALKKGGAFKLPRRNAEFRTWCDSLTVV